jgi:signal transduction histidine kinase
LRSLRGRVVAGAMLWTVGLLAIAHLVSLAVLVRYPHLRLIAHSALIGALAIGCLAAGIAQVRRGLSPFQELRARLAVVRDGRAARLTGAYPAEVQPLVDDLNGLIAHREQAIERAIARAGDLAHGLKTPLAVLAMEVERTRAAGQPDLAEALAQQIDRMRRQIDYHLASARAAASGSTAGQRTALAVAIDALARTMQRLHAARDIAVGADAAGDLTVRARREDVDEMLGNLVDNACTWARSRVHVAAVRRGDRVLIAVDDDGPGVDPSMRETVIQRGVRGEAGAPGSGLGLAIVRELATLYDGSLRLETSRLGGLRAELELPAAD